MSMRSGVTVLKLLTDLLLRLWWNAIWQTCWPERGRGRRPGPEIKTDSVMAMQAQLWRTETLLLGSAGGPDMTVEQGVSIEEQRQ